MQAQRNDLPHTPETAWLSPRKILVSTHPRACASPCHIPEKNQRYYRLFALHRWVEMRDGVRKRILKNK